MEKAIKKILILLVWISVCAFCIMLLWNQVVPEIFGLTRIDFGQSAVLFVLCDILFRSGDPVSIKD